jgi:hypothetical protein
MDLFGKDTTVTKVIERTKPTLITVGKRQIISSGRWNNDLMADYVMMHGACRYIPIGELAKTAYMQAMPRNKERVRKNIFHLFRTILLKYGRLLVVEYGSPHNRAQAVKLFDTSSDLDRKALWPKIERMRKRRELSETQYEMAVEVLQRGVDTVTETTRLDAGA